MPRRYRMRTVPFIVDQRVGWPLGGRMTEVRDFGHQRLAIVVCVGRAVRAPAANRREAQVSDLRTLLIGGAMAALAAALALPAAAADTKGTLAIVNGMPGKRVDVCLNGDEIGSGVRYGGRVQRNVVGTGTKKLKVFRRDPRECGGGLLAKRSFSLGPGVDLTVVATSKAPKVVIFENTGWGEIPPLGPPSALAYSLFRSAAGFGVNLKWTAFSPGPLTPLDPAADPVFLKGDEHVIFGGGNYISEIRATLPETPSIVALRRVFIEVSRRYELILLGTKPGNARFALIDRAISNPSP